MEVFTTKELAKTLKCSRQRIYKLIENGEIKAIYLGNGYRILKKEVEIYFSKNKKPPTSSPIKHIYSEKKQKIEQFFKKQKIN